MLQIFLSKIFAGILDTLLQLQVKTQDLRKIILSLKRLHIAHIMVQFWTLHQLSLPTLEQIQYYVERPWSGIVCLLVNKCAVCMKCQMPNGFFGQTCKIRSKTEKVNIIIKFYIFKMVLVPNFSLNWQFWIFGPN